MRSTQNTICEAHSRLVLDVSFCHVESTLDTTHWLNVILRLSIISATMDQLCKDMTVKILPLYAILKACIYDTIIYIMYVYINTYCRCNVHNCSVDVDSINSTPSCHQQSITRNGPLLCLPPSLQWWSPRPSWPGTDNNAPMDLLICSERQSPPPIF